MCNGWVMLDVVEPIMLWRKGIASCVLELRAPGVEICNGEWSEKCCVPASVYSFTALSALWGWWRVLPRGSWMLLVMRQPQRQVKGLLVIFTSIPCIITANKRPAAGFQGAGKLDTSLWVLSISVCSQCYVWVCTGWDFGQSESPTAVGKDRKKSLSFLAGLTCEFWQG